MRVEKFVSNGYDKVSNLILNKYPMMSYNQVMKLLRNKDIKINGVRIKEDVKLNVGDEVCFFVNELNFELEIVYQDDNVLVAFKKRGIETVSENKERDLLSVLETQTNQQLFAVHRLDMNTEGIVVFAKNLESKEQLDDAFKNRTIDKFYYALVYGVFSEKEKELVAYLKKDSNKSLVYVSDKQVSGYDKIVTKYKVVDEFFDSSLIEVELLTGKTHQIRAHMAHIGHFVIGDQKYGDSKINKILNKKYQCLCAYRLVFHFKQGLLSYLDGKEILLDKSKIDFCKNFK